VIAIGSSKVVRLSFNERYLVGGITYQVGEGFRRPSAVAQLERLLRDAGFDEIAALTAEQTIEFPSVLDYVRFQLLAIPMAAMSRSLLRIHRPHLIDDPGGQRFKHLSLISSLRPGAAMPVPFITLPVRVLASARMMDTPGPRLLEGEQDGVNQSATT
jgi:hypothetical protein